MYKYRVVSFMGENENAMFKRQKCHERRKEKKGN